MTTDSDLRAYLDAHGTDGAPTTEGWHVADGESGAVFALEVVRDADDALLVCDGGTRGHIVSADDRRAILRHAPLRLAAPDLPCGHPAACVRPTTGHAGTTRWCGWCEAEGRADAALVRAERAERERDASIAELARLAPDGDRQWARDLLARHEPTGGYDEEGGR